MTLDEKINEYEKYLNEALSEEDRGYARQRAEFFKIDIPNISEEVATQAGTFAYIANLCAVQTQKRNTAKLEEKVTKSRRRLEIKQISTKEEKLTVDDLTAKVETDVEVCNACGQHIYEERILNHLEADREAAKQKSQMLYLLTNDIKREQMLKTGM